ncbi:hypothetical protein ACFLYR_07870 [Chloroflexota bacterium]
MGTLVGINDPQAVRRHCRTGDLKRLNATNLEGGSNRPWVIYVGIFDMSLQQDYNRYQES